MTMYPRIEMNRNGQALIRVNEGHSVIGDSKEELLKAWFNSRGWFHVYHDRDTDDEVYTFPQVHFNRMEAEDV